MISGLALASQVADTMYVQRLPSLNVREGAVFAVPPVPPHE